MTKNDKLEILFQLRQRFMNLNNRTNNRLSYALCACLTDVLARNPRLKPNATLEEIGMEKPFSRTPEHYWYTVYGYSAYDLRLKAIDNTIDKHNSR